MHNVISCESGARAFPPVLCPTSLYDDITNAGITRRWPFPQLVSSDETMLLFADVSGVGQVFPVTYAAGVWTLGTALTLTEISSGVTLSGLSANFNPWHLYARGGFWIATNGVDIISYDFINGSATAALVVSAVHATAEPFVRVNSIAQAFNRIIYSSLHPNAEWLALFDDCLHYGESGRLGSTLFSELGNAIWYSGLRGAGATDVLKPSLALPTEQVTDGDFSETTESTANYDITAGTAPNPTAWTLGTNWFWDTLTSVRHVAGFAGDLTQAVADQLVSVNEGVYAVTVKITNYVAGTVTLTVGSATHELSSEGTHYFSFSVPSGGPYDVVLSAGATFEGYVDIVSFKQLDNWTLGAGFYLDGNGRLAWSSPTTSTTQSTSCTVGTAYNIALIGSGQVRVTAGTEIGANQDITGLDLKTEILQFTGSSTLSISGTGSGYLSSINVQATENWMLRRLKEFGGGWLNLRLGEVYRTEPLGEFAVAYCENGLAVLHEISSALAIGRRLTAPISIANRNAVASDGTNHMFVDRKGYIWYYSKFDAYDYKLPTRVGYAWELEEVADEPILSVVYDPVEQLFRIGYDGGGYTWSPKYGLCSNDQQIECLVLRAGEVISTESNGDPTPTTFEITSDELALDSKTWINVFGVGVVGAEIENALVYIYTAYGFGDFTASEAISLNAEGIAKCLLPIRAGMRVKFKITGTLLNGNSRISGLDLFVRPHRDAS